MRESSAAFFALPLQDQALRQTTSTAQPFYSGQNEKWNARDVFSTAQQPVGSFNQYGGTLGGPVVRNKMFFFGTYEGYRDMGGGRDVLNGVGRLADFRHRPGTIGGAFASITTGRSRCP